MRKSRNTLYAQTVAFVTRYTNISIPRTHTTRWVFWVCCAFYLFTVSGHTYSPDEETMYAVTRSIVENGRVTIDASADQPLAALRTGFSGGRVAPYGILPSFIAVPFYFVGTLFTEPNTLKQWDLTHLLVSLVNVPISAGCVALFMRLLQRLRMPRASIPILTITYALGSLTWPYSRTFFSEPLTALLLLWSLESAVASHKHLSSHTSSIILSGFMAGCIMPTRIAATVTIPIVLLYIVYMSTPQNRLRTFMLWCAGCIPGGVLFLFYNFARFDVPMATGYSSETNAFITPILVGLNGLLIHPVTGLVWYMPLMLFAPIGAWRLWVRRPNVVVLCLALITSHVALYAGWNAWDGGGVWGPRFLVPIVPYILCLCSGVWRKPQLTFHHVAYPLLGMSIIINLLGCIVNFNIDSNLPGPQPTPIITHLLLAGQRLTTAITPNQTCTIRDGWYASESASGKLVQRSGARGTIECRLPRLSVVHFTLDDRRPDNAPKSYQGLVINTAPAMTIPNGKIRHIDWLMQYDHANLIITNNTWNPKLLGYSDRDDELGPVLIDLTGTPNPITIANATIMPIPTPPKERWAWYYNPTNQHVVDWWGWYIQFTTLATWTWYIVATWGGLIIGCLLLAYRRATRARRPR